MSGKTSFLKTLALNIHLSNKIGYALCDSIEIPKFKIITSIKNEDNLEEGLSYFMDELLRIKRIIDQTNSTDDLLLIAIDEIFRGTNSKDRITLASSVLNYLSGKNCLVIVTTHDLDIVKFVKENYSPYFFNNSFVNNEVIFDYVIQKGIQYETNVIALVRSLSFSPEIIKSALEFEKRIKNAHKSKS
jgi:DNA mismatch repair ATPase MutS